MSQMTHFYPLEKLKPRLLIWFQLVTLHLLRGRAWARRVWAAMINETAYHARRPLLSDDSLICQSSLAMALGGSDKAIIVQKLHEWIETNRSKNNWKNKINGVWGTHNSYEDWRKEHFGWLSDDAIGRHVRALEKIGVIRTRAMKGSREKWYTIEYGKLNALLKDAKINAAVNLHPAKAQKKRADVNEDRANPHDDSSSKSNKKTKPETQVSRVATVPQASVPDQPRALTEADSDSHSVSLSSEESTTGQNATTAPLPSSAQPLSPDACKTWDMVAHQLRSQWGAASFDPLLKEAQLLACNEGIYTIAVRTAHAKDMLQGRYYRKIESVFRGLHDTPVRVVFEVVT